MNDYIIAPDFIEGRQFSRLAAFLLLDLRLVDTSVSVTVPRPPLLFLFLYVTVDSKKWLN